MADIDSKIIYDHEKQVAALKDEIKRLRFFGKFSERELEVLQLIADDKVTKEISTITSLSPRTVESIRQRLKKKTHTNTIGGLVMYAVNNNLISFKNKS